MTNWLYGTPRQNAPGAEPLTHTGVSRLQSFVSPSNVLHEKRVCALFDFKCVVADLWRGETVWMCLRVP